MEENDGYNYYYPYKYNQYRLYDNYVNGNIYPSQNYYYDNGVILKKNNDKKAINVIYFQGNYPSNNNPKEPVSTNGLSRIKSFYNNLSGHSKQNSSNMSQLFIKRNNSQFHMNNKYRIINDNYNTEIKNNNTNYFINNNVYQPEIKNNIIYYSPRIINNPSQNPNNINKTEIMISYDMNMNMNMNTNMNYNKSEKTIFTKNENSRNDFNVPKVNHNRKMLFKIPTTAKLKPLDNEFNNNDLYYDSIYSNSLNKYTNNQEQNNSIYYNETNYYNIKNSQNSNNNSNYYLNTDNISNIYPQEMIKYNKNQISSNMINKNQNNKKTIITIYQKRGRNISDVNKIMDFNPTKNTQLERYNKINLNKRSNHKSDLCLNCKKKQSQNTKEEIKEIKVIEKPNKMNTIKNIKIIDHNKKVVEQNQKKIKEIKNQIFNNDRKKNIIIKVSNNYKFHEIKETSKSKEKVKEKDINKNKEIGFKKIEQNKQNKNLTNRNKIPVNKSYYTKRNNNLNESNKKEEILKNSNETNFVNQSEKYYSIIKKNYELYLQTKSKRNNAIKKIPKNTEKKRKRQKSKNQIYFEKKLDRKKSMSFIEYIADYSPKNSISKYNSIQKNKTSIKETLSHKKFKEDDGTFFMDEEILKIKNKLFDDKKTNFGQNNRKLQKNAKNANKIRPKKYSYNELNIQIGCRFMIIKQNIKNRIYCLSGKSIYFYSENLKRLNKIKEIKKS